MDIGHLTSWCPLERFHYPLSIFLCPSLIILSPSYCCLHPSLHLIVISVCASHQASPLRTHSGPLLGDGLLINEGACVCVCVFAQMRACVSFSAVITN